MKISPELKSFLIGSAVHTGSAAVAGAAIGNPIGVIGGALFGATRHFSSHGLGKAVGRVFESSDENSTTFRKIATIAFIFFGGAAAAWGALALAGFSLTFSHVALLTTSGLGFAIILEMFWSTFFDRTLTSGL